MVAEGAVEPHAVVIGFEPVEVTALGGVSAGTYQGELFPKAGM